MAQPLPPKGASHAVKSKPAPRNAREEMKPGGPIKPKPMGFENPGVTPNLRGVEPNTERHKGIPNPEQHGTPGHIGGADHRPGMGAADDSHGHGVPTPIPRVAGRHSDVSARLPTPEPGDVAR